MPHDVLSRGDYFRFGSVFIKKNNQTEIFFEKKRNRVKPTGFGSVRFFRAKTGSNRFYSVFLVLARFFSVLARFFSVLARFFPVLAWFFPVWLGFLVWLCFSGLAWFCFRFFVGFGSIRFGFFGFLLIKPKPNRPVFSKI
jgi:hypothetical protein